MFDYIANLLLFVLICFYCYQIIIYRKKLLEYEKINERIRKLIDEFYEKIR
jgi:hypothetical protein